MEAVAGWLAGLGLGKYAEAFYADGYDDLTTLAALNDPDVKELAAECGMPRSIAKRLQQVPGGWFGRLVRSVAFGLVAFASGLVAVVLVAFAPSVTGCPRGAAMPRGARRSRGSSCSP